MKQRILPLIVFLGAILCFGQSYGQLDPNCHSQKIRVAEEIDTFSCNHIGERGMELSHGPDFKAAYDTMRLYIESCAMQYGSWSAFNYINGDLADMGGTLQRWIDGREWYKRVLYYNPDTTYYCADVDAILTTFQYFERRGHDYLGALAIVKYLHDNHKCMWYDEEKNFEFTYRSTIDEVLSYWRDTVKDSLKTPLDTTLPSIDELGLGILRGQSKVDATERLAIDAIGDLFLVENPIRTEAILRYRLNHGAMVRVDVYDALGRQMSGEGEGYKHEGEYQISVDTRSWSSGTYFIRVSTMGGEVQTIKAIRE